MATKTEPSVAGKLLAKARRQSGLSAAELAERTGGLVTRTMVTNVESGRKRDLTVIELMQVASALGISPLALMVDFDDPWGKVAVPGLAAPYGVATNVEYVAMAQALLVEMVDQPDSFWGLGKLIDGLRGAEHSLNRLEMTKASVARGDEWEHSATAWRLKGDNSGHSIILTEMDSPVRGEYQGVLFEYQDIITTIAFFEEIASVFRQVNLPDSVWERVNRIGDAVEEILDDVPVPNADVERQELPRSDMKSLRARLRHPGHLDQLFEARPSRGTARPQAYRDFYQMSLYSRKEVETLGGFDGDNK